METKLTRQEEEIQTPRQEILDYKFAVEQSPHRRRRAAKLQAAKFPPSVGIAAIASTGC